jgi:ATP-binding cassette subfamily F protein 3
MIQIRNCSKSFGAETILHQLNLNINENEKIGLIGPNGSGKTTLMQLIARLQQPDHGSILYTIPGLQVAYLPQQVSAPDGQTVGEYIGLPIADFSFAYQELEGLSAHILTVGADYQKLLEDIQTSEWLMEAMLPMQSALNLEDVPLDQPFDHLSSGQKTRTALMKIALKPAQVILLDEPTNHLDQTGRAWLMNWIRQSKSAMVIISHDRDFIDQVVKHLWVQDKTKQELIQFEGTYSAYRLYQQTQQEKQSKAYELQLEEIQKLEHAVKVTRAHAIKKKGGKGDSGDKFAKGFFSDRTTHVVKKAKIMEKRIHELEENLLPLINKDWLLSIRFQEASRSGDRVIEAQQLEFGYPGKVVVRSTALYVRFGDRIVLSGENGSGKTTILQTLAGILPPLSGSFITGHGIQRGYLTQEQQDLPDEETAVSYLQRIKSSDETTVRNFLARYLFTQNKVIQPIPPSPMERKKDWRWRDWFIADAMCSFWMNP